MWVTSFFQPTNDAWGSVWIGGPLSTKPTSGQPWWVTTGEGAAASLLHVLSTALSQVTDWRKAPPSR